MDVYWYEQCAVDVPVADDWLSDSEKARVAAFRIPKRRADWRLGRWGSYWSTGKPRRLRAPKTQCHTATVVARIEFAPVAAKVPFRALFQ